MISAGYDSVGFLRFDGDHDGLDRNHSPALAALKKQVEELTKALEFYADVSKYHAPLTGGMGDLWADCGQIARAALEAAGGRG